MDEQEKYYWVKDKTEGWIIGSVYSDGAIYVTGNDEEFKESDFEKIGHEILNPYPFPYPFE